jgi:hypothetical protein
MKLKLLKTTFLTLALAATLTAGAFAQSTDYLTVATVTYNGTTTIYGKELKDAINRAVRSQLVSTATTPPDASALNSAVAAGVKQLSASDKKQVLDNLVNQKLVIQAAKKANTIVTPTDVTKAMTNFRTGLVQSLGEDIMSDDNALAQAIQNYMGYSSVTDFQNNYIQPSLLVQNYITKIKANELNVAQPTQQEIKRYFRMNASTFVQPETISFSYIFQQFTPGSTTSKNAARSAMNTMAGLIGNSGSKFTSQWTTASNNKTDVNKPTGQNGQMYLNSQYEQAFIQQFGEDALDALLDMGANQVSAVLEAPNAYVILKMESDTPARLLTLTDPYPGNPQSSMQEALNSLIYQQKVQQAQQSAEQEVVTDLKKTAQIVYNDANLAKVIGS